MSETDAFRRPELSYIRLPNNKATVVCTCGWRDPLGEMSVSPFDPLEALTAAFVAHPFCTTEPAPKSERVSKIIAELDHWLAVQVLTNKLDDNERKELARALREYLGPVPEFAKET